MCKGQGSCWHSYLGRGSALVCYRPIFYSGVPSTDLRRDLIEGLRGLLEGPVGLLVREPRLVPVLAVVPILATHCLVGKDLLEVVGLSVEALIHPKDDRRPVQRAVLILQRQGGEGDMMRGMREFEGAQLGVAGRTAREFVFAMQHEGIVSASCVSKKDRSIA